MAKLSKKKYSKNKNRTLRNIIIAISIMIIGVLAIKSLNDHFVKNALANSSSLPATQSETVDLETGLPAEITPAQTNQLIGEGAVILDVREVSEWTEGHIEGAKLIPLAELPNRMNELPKDAEIVVVCRSGNRSAQGRDILLHAGFKQVTSMAGGMNAWRSQGYAIITGN